MYYDLLEKCLDSIEHQAKGSKLSNVDYYKRTFLMNVAMPESVVPQIQAIVDTATETDVTPFRKAYNKLCEMRENAVSAATQVTITGKILEKPKNSFRLLTGSEWSWISVITDRIGINAKELWENNPDKTFRFTGYLSFGPENGKYKTDTHVIATKCELLD